MGSNTIIIASDHGGTDMRAELSAFLREQNFEVTEIGPKQGESADYPDVADEAVKVMFESNINKAIMICGTGIGISIAANRHKGIRAALCHDEFTARLSKEHNNANVLVLGARVLAVELAKAITLKWLETSFSGGRHEKRVEKLG